MSKDQITATNNAQIKDLIPIRTDHRTTLKVAQDLHIKDKIVLILATNNVLLMSKDRIMVTNNAQIKDHILIKTDHKTTLRAGQGLRTKDRTDHTTIKAVRDLLIKVKTDRITILRAGQDLRTKDRTDHTTIKAVRINADHNNKHLPFCHQLPPIQFHKNKIPLQIKANIAIRTRMIGETKNPTTKKTLISIKIFAQTNPNKVQ